MEYATPDASALARQVVGSMPDDGTAHEHTNRGLGDAGYLPMQVVYPLVIGSGFMTTTAASCRSGRRHAQHRGQLDGLWQVQCASNWPLVVAARESHQQPAD